MSTTPWQTRDYVYVSAECVIGVLSALGNGLVLLAIWRTRALRTVTNCFIGSLAAADTLVGIIVPPSVILPYRGLPTNFFGCVFLNTVVVLITNISILNLLAVALERFLAISNPFRYQRMMTVRRAMCVVVFTWVVAVLLGLIPTMGWYKGRDGFTTCAFTQVIEMEYMVYLIFFGVNLPPLFFMLVIYMYIFHIIRQQHRRTTAQLTVLSRDERRNARQQKREVRGAKGLAYVIILFAVCWMPLHVLNCITLFAPDKSPDVAWLLAAIVLSHANSFVNPFLYAFSNSQFKRAMKRILFCGHFQPAYTSDSSDGGTRSRASRLAANRSLEVINNNNGFVYTDPAVANGHASASGGDSDDQRFGKGQQQQQQQQQTASSRINGNGGVVNEGFDEEGAEITYEMSGGYPRNRKKSLRWSENVETIPVSPGGGGGGDNNNSGRSGSSSSTAVQNLRTRDRGSPPAPLAPEAEEEDAANNKVWVTPSSRSLQMKNLAEGSSTTSSPPRTRNESNPTFLSSSSSSSSQRLPEDCDSDGGAPVSGDAANVNGNGNGSNNALLTLEDVTNDETVDAAGDALSLDDNRTGDASGERNVTGEFEKSESLDSDVVIELRNRTASNSGDDLPNGADRRPQQPTNAGDSAPVAPKNADANYHSPQEGVTGEKRGTGGSAVVLSVRSTEEGEEDGVKEYAFGSKGFISVRL